MSGDRDKARAVLSKLEKRNRTEKISPFALALGYLGLGETDSALTALERAVDEHDIALTAVSLLNERSWDSMRGQPRFTRVLERMNLGPFIARANRP